MSLDWQRSNARLWEGRVLIGGRVSKANQSVSLTSAVIKRAMGLSISADEARLEDSLQRSGMIA
jgi:DNA sulfur modification protein DndB